MMNYSTSYDVLLIGTYFCDLIITGLPEVPRLGADLFGERFDMVAGGAFNTAHALHRLGLKVGWPCDLGNDLFSQFFFRQAQEVGLDTHLFRIHDQPYRLISVSFSFTHDRGFISYADKLDQQQPIAPLIERYKPRCLHLSHLVDGPEQVEMVTAARQVGALVSMDCQWTKKDLGMPEVVEAIQRVDLFLPNASEAMQLTQTDDVERALELLSGLGPLVVIKVGSDGCLAGYKGQGIKSYAIPVKAYDTTGAGDSFNAGFLYGYLKGVPLETCLQYGNICGGMATTCSGVSAIPDAASIEQLLVRYYDR